MTTLIFDCETDGLLDKLTKIHSLVIKNADTGEVVSCCHPFPGSDESKYADIMYGLMLLQEADLVVGHNIIKFDIPALQKVYPWFDIKPSKVRDTLVLSRLVWSDLTDRDMGAIRKGVLPGKLRGSHALKAWGYRLGVLKGTFGETTDWSSWTPSMQDYCEQDVEVTTALWQKIQEKEPAPKAVELEMMFAHIMAKQERFGFRFDKQKAAALYAELSAKRAELDRELMTAFDPWYVNAGEFTPKRDNKSAGYVAGATFCKVALQVFNPSSRPQIADRLMKVYGWKPTETTEGGAYKVDESVLAPLPYPPAKKLTERFLLEKRLGQLAEGKQGWLRLEVNGRIHGSVNTIGAVTGRCTHANPNVAQVPSVSAPYGTQCRELFHVDPGYVQVGVDASGLELRCLGHYMAKYDGGAYVQIILEGDIHTVNQEAAGLPTRINAKTFISMG